MTTGRLLILLTLSALLLGREFPVLGAQIPALQFDADTPGALFTPRDRRLQSMLEKSRRELSDPEGDHRDALQALQQILQESEDVFLDSTMKTGLREEASQTLSGLNDELRRQYEQMFGANALALLNSPGDRKANRGQVVRRYFHTKAGADAAFQLAAHEMDRGNLLVAARLLDRIRSQHFRAAALEPELSMRCIVCYWRSGELERAARILLQTVGAGDDAALLGSDVPKLATVTEAKRWLTEQFGVTANQQTVARAGWHQPGGSPGRNASVEPVAPLFDDAWTVPLVFHKDADDPNVVEELAILLEGVVSTAREFGWKSVPVLNPLLIDDLVVFPSYGQVKAVDRKTGDLRWVALPADHTFVDALSTSTGARNRQIAPEMKDFLIQRAWIDATSSQISSDGDRVYLVRDSGMVGGLPPHFSAVAQLNHPRRPKSYNALRAYDASGGNWVWEVGGGRSRAALPLAGTFFLGPPLVVDDTLYVLGEDLGQIRLHALVPDSGELLWSLPLANGDSDVEDDLDRRLAGLTPTYAGGLLVCPTGSGLIVAVDPLTRTLEWGMRYRDERSHLMPQRFGRGPFMGLQTSRSQQVTMDELMREERWHDSTVLVCGTSLLVTPPDVAEPDDERQLICLNLLDGSPRWPPRPRGEALYVGGVHANTVLLVGERNVEGVDLESGRTLWEIGVGKPSGRGVRDGALYHLPLASGEIATIDISGGQLLSRAPLRSGGVLGNLVAVDGQLVSLSASEVRSFRSRGEVVEQIAADLSTDPENGPALAARGELRLHSGEMEAGLQDLRAAVDAEQPNSRAGQLLVATLLSRLRSDFQLYRDDVEELDVLTQGSPLRTSFLMEYANGLHESGETLLAFEQYLRLLSEGQQTDEFDDTEDGRSVRRDRHVLGRLAELYAGVPMSERVEFERAVDRWMQRERESGDRGAAAMLATAIPHLRNESKKRQNEIAFPRTWSSLQEESRLLVERRSGSVEDQPAIAARLVKFYAGHGRSAIVAQLLTELETRWKDAICLNGKTGVEWATSVRESEPVASLLGDVPDWSDEGIDVREGAANANPYVPLPMEGPVDPIVSGFVFLTDNRGQVFVQDGFGRPLNTEALQPLSGTGASFQTQYLMQRGHRALVFQGTQFKLIDLLDGTPRIVFQETLVANDPTQASGMRFHQRRTVRQLGFRGIVLWSDDPGENGSVGPLNDSVLCVLKGHTLSAHSPFTGDLYWVAEGVPHGAEIFADEDYVLLVPVGQNVVHVYRALDGRKLGVRTLPTDVVRDRRGADWGRYFLRMTSKGEEQRIALYDPVAEENLWERRIGKRFYWAPRDGHEICLVDEDGHLLVLSPDDGRVLVEREVTVPDGLLSVRVLNLPDQWLLASYSRPAADADAQLAQVQVTQESFAVNGPVTAFDRTTDESQWTRVIANQMVTPGLPGRWPILSLSGISQRVPGIGAERRTHMLVRRIELINRKTGDSIFVAETDGSARRLDHFWQVQQTQPQLQLTYGHLQLSVSFRPQAEVVDDTTRNDSTNRQEQQDAPAPMPPSPDN